MSEPQTPYFSRFAAAFVQGRLGAEGDLTEAEQDLLTAPIAQLSDDRLQELIELGRNRGLRMHKFKKTMGLARVRSVLGILRGLQPSELLDVGSGRGVFLWPLLEEFPYMSVTSVDLLEMRVRDLLAVRDGGIKQLNAIEGDITKLDLPDGSFDVVTLLEVLEHIPDSQAALDNAVRLARRFVVLSVPSHEDDNPEHIHLFTKDALSAMLVKAGAQNVNVQFVLNHMIAVANVSR